MQTVRIVQAVVLMMIVAMAASCAASKEYTSKLFAPRIPVIKDSQATAVKLRFLEIDSSEKDNEGWVTTDIIMGRDTISNTLTLDKLAKVFPPVSGISVPATKNEQAKINPAEAEVKPPPVESVPVAKNSNPGEVRTKRSREK
jgi:hypothetical protein